MVFCRRDERREERRDERRDERNHPTHAFHGYATYWSNLDKITAYVSWNSL